ncbi:MAG: DUF6575 domain-containing protein [Coleofasciculaceae cyanobacterium]
MSLLLQATTIGNLEMLEVYEYYDKPCLFSCRNGSGQIYLAVWIDETPNSDSWLYVPLSSRRFQYIRSGGIDLHDAFLMAEDNFVFQIITFNNDTPAEVTTIPCERLDEDLLPMAGEFLTCDTQTLSTMEVKEVTRTALEIRREVLNLAFKFPTIHRTEAPAADLGIILQSLQYLLNAIGQVRTGNAKLLGKIPKRVIEQTELAVAGTFASSFGVELVASSQADLFGDSLAGAAIEEFLALIKIGSKAQELRECLLKLQSRSASRYRDFLQSLVKARTGVRLNWGSPQPNRGGYAELSLVIVKDIIAIINQIEAEAPEEYQVTGQLIGANIRTKNYEIRELETDIKYSGQILDEALPDVETATLNQIYVTVIRAIVEILPITGEEKVKYQLVSLRLLDFEESISN